jgi:hypothetical protein
VITSTRGGGGGATTTTLLAQLSAVITRTHNNPTNRIFFIRFIFEPV